MLRLLLEAQTVEKMRVKSSSSAEGGGANDVPLVAAGSGVAALSRCWVVLSGSAGGGSGGADGGGGGRRLGSTDILSVIEKVILGGWLIRRLSGPMECFQNVTIFLSVWLHYRGLAEVNCPKG